MTHYIKLMRPKHYIKNVLIFAPIVYAGVLIDASMIFSAVAAFLAFCFVASAVYVINDITDCEKDKLHPVNKLRPIASGKISKRAGAIFSTLLACTAFLIVFFMNNRLVAIFIFAYIVLNSLYTYWLKHMPVLDCFCVAGGFVFRIFAGAAAVSQEVSQWLFLTVLAGALFMAFGKRRGEMMHMQGNSARKVLQGYSLEFLNGSVYALAGISIVFYALWTITSTDLMVYTVPLVIFIICKYLLNTQKENSYGDPVSTLLSDGSLIGAVLIFGALSVFLLYI